MTRILYWNVQIFSQPKIVQLAGPTSAKMAQDRLNHMLDVIAPLPPAPPRPLDLIILVEVSARNMEIATPGLILNPNSAAGHAVCYLLNEIRQRTGEEWCLIPPPMDGEGGKREAVAILYKAATLAFTGPWIYAKALSGAKLRMPVTNIDLNYLQDYPAAYAQRFPATLRYWGVGGHNVPEWQGAAQTEFANLKFPSQYDRAPTYVRMVDMSTMRKLNIFAVHTSPASAAEATRSIAEISEVRFVQDDEISVVVGDFNCHSFADVPVTEDPYYSLRDPFQMQYEMLLKARMTATGPVVYSRQPYCMTHLLPNTRPYGDTGYVIVATPYNASNGLPSPTNNVYPRLGYMGSSYPTLNDKGAIDNAFVKYGANMAPVPHNTTIVNTVVGQPYTAIAPPPPGVTADLTSGLPQACLMNMAHPAMVPTGFAPGTWVSNFNNWSAYQHIHDVSDHLALIFDV